MLLHPISGRDASVSVYGFLIYWFLFMSTFDWSALLGPLLLTKTVKPTEQVLTDKHLIALYFGANWCPPCRGFKTALKLFNDQLIKAKTGESGYEMLLGKESDEVIEIIFISSDHDASSFKSHYEETIQDTAMSRCALPFEAVNVKRKLCSQFGVQGIPSLIILDGIDGRVVDKNASRTVLKYYTDMENRDSESMGSRYLPSMGSKNREVDFCVRCLEKWGFEGVKKGWMLKKKEVPVKK